MESRRYLFTFLQTHVFAAKRQGVANRAAPSLLSDVISRPGLLRFTNDYLAECFTREDTPHVNELAARLRISASKFSKLFLDVVGERPSHYLKRKQSERAEKLLCDTDLDFTTIARASGFGTLTTFFRAFRRITGMTPQAYRDINRTKCDPHWTG